MTTRKEIAFKWWRAALLEVLETEFKDRIGSERKDGKLKNAGLPPYPSSIIALQQGTFTEKDVLFEDFETDPDGEQFYVLALSLGIQGSPKYRQPVSVLEPIAKRIRASGE